MFKLYDWFVQNWKALTILLGFLMIFSLIKPGTNLIRNVSDGFKEIFTPVGFFVFLLLLGLAIFLFTYFKGLFS